MLLVSCICCLLWIRLFETSQINFEMDGVKLYFSNGLMFPCFKKLQGFMLQDPLVVRRPKNNFCWWNGRQRKNTGQKSADNAANQPHRLDKYEDTPQHCQNILLKSCIQNKQCTRLSSELLIIKYVSSVFIPYISVILHIALQDI